MMDVNELPFVYQHGLAVLANEITTFPWFFGFLFSVSSVSCSLGCYCKVVLAWTLIGRRRGGRELGLREEMYWEDRMFRMGRGVGKRP